MVEKDVEESFQNFWKHIILNENEEIDLDQVKKELFDYQRLLENVSSVYSEVTGGLLSKPGYDAETIISVFNEKFGEKAELVDLLTDDWLDITADCVTNRDYKEA
ncbi:MAG: hypothetical protein Q4A15_11655, partial [Prevotellaceae bacterium]|nr:hypothetical protein [Prevotellaceae bacterium]